MQVQRLYISGRKKDNSIQYSIHISLCYGAMRENYIFVNIIKNVLCLNTSISEEVVFTIYSTAIVCVGDIRANNIYFKCKTSMKLYYYYT